MNTKIICAAIALALITLIVWAILSTQARAERRGLRSDNPNISSSGTAYRYRYDYRFIALASPAPERAPTP